MVNLVLTQEVVSKSFKETAEARGTTVPGVWRKRYQGAFSTAKARGLQAMKVSVVLYVLVPLAARSFPYAADQLVVI